MLPLVGALHKFFLSFHSFFMKHFFTLSLFGLCAVLAGCSTPTPVEAPAAAEPAEPPAAPVVEAPPPGPKTTFDFYPASLTFEEGGADVIPFAVRLKAEEGLSAAQAVLRFDPAEVEIFGVRVASGLLSVVDDSAAENGVLSVAAGITEQDRIANKHAEFFSAMARLSPGVESTEVSFISEKLSALLADQNATESIQTQNLPRLRLARKAAEVSLDQLEEPEAL